MVVNLCQLHFQTTIRCNKLSADGYDVTNLLSPDPSLRRRGFKLEYFLRPPVQVTMAFRWQVEVCGVDVELWSGPMEQGGATRRVDVYTSQLEAGAGADSDARSDSSFLQVGRCEAREGLRLCFRAARFRPRPPTLHHPPVPTAGATPSELWSRGPQALGSVWRLCVSIPFSSAGFPLGFKALAVWGLPARSCPPEALEEFQNVYHRSMAPAKPLLPPKAPTTFPTPSPDPISATSGPNAGRHQQDEDQKEEPIPEEFLDPLTQELMVLPMVLPSGAIVDISSLEEYQRREATWGRPPNDPFTGVPFTADSKPLPCPLLKRRIDHLVLRRGGRPGMCGGGGGGGGVGVELQGPQASRLVLSTSSSTPTPEKPQTMTPNSLLSDQSPSTPLTSNSVLTAKPHSSASAHNSSLVDKSRSSFLAHHSGVLGKSRSSTSTHPSAPNDKRPSATSESGHNSTSCSKRHLPTLSLNSSVSRIPPTARANNSAMGHHLSVSVIGSGPRWPAGRVAPSKGRGIIVQQRKRPHENPSDLSQSKNRNSGRCTINITTPLKTHDPQSEVSHSDSGTIDISSPAMTQEEDQMSKRMRLEFNTAQSHSGSHEERLSASLDAALSCALKGLPSFTAQKKPPDQPPHTHTGEDQCSQCSMALSSYSTSTPAYALPCRHLLCRPCLTAKTTAKARGPQIICPSCGTASLASAVTRVHH